MSYLRWVLLIATAAFRLAGGSLRWRWLFHYLAGSGRDLRVPESVAKPVLKDWLPEHGSRTMREFCMGDSRNYEGHGFWDRPVLFYLVGGWSGKVEFQDEKAIVTGTDRYDWHPDPSRGGRTEFWHDSPLPEGKLWRLGHMLAQRLFGEKYFPGGWTEHYYREGGRWKECSVSNRLWADLAEFGAREFTSHIHVEFSMEEWDELFPKEWEEYTTEREPVTLGELA